MMRVGGSRRKTRHKLSKNIREKGKVNLTKYFQGLKDGDNVILKAEPAIQRGMYHPRYHGKAGIIIGKTGNCYKVKIKDFNMQKTCIVHPIHLKKV